MIKIDTSPGRLGDALDAVHRLRQLEHERMAILDRLLSMHSERELRMLPSAGEEVAQRLKAASAAKTAEIEAAHVAAEDAWERWEAGA